MAKVKNLGHKLGFGLIMLAIGWYLGGNRVWAHNPPCTILYEGVPSDPTCRYQMVPDPNDPTGLSTIGIYVCD